MKNVLFLLVLAVGVIFLGSCSSFGPAANNRTEANNASSANMQGNTGPATGDANIYPLKEAVPNSNGANGRTNNAVNVISSGASRPAPDDSRIISELGAVPTETRIFNSHPVLAKVVKTGLPNNQTVKIYVKGGKVIELPGDKIPNIAASADSIMREAGLTMPTPRPDPGSDTKRNDIKKAEQKQ
jgi:hypothetical protein